MNKIDEVAAAICGPCLGNPREMAIAALKAMREPDFAMVKAGGDIHPGNEWFSPAEFYSSSKEIWKAMIDAALEEGS